jgi:hypothetical protein
MSRWSCSGATLLAARGPALPVNFITLSSGGFADIATYQLGLPTRASVTEELRLIPGGVATATIHVSLKGSSFATVAHTVTLRLVTPTLTATGPSSVVPGSQPEFDFTLTNTTAADYTDVQLGVAAYPLTCYGGNFSVLRYNGGWWQHTGSSGLTSPVAAISLNAGQSVRIRLRLYAPPNRPGCTTKGQVAVAAWLPGSAVVTGYAPHVTTPGFSVSGDPPFSIR